jgi:hypothetical protein
MKKPGERWRRYGRGIHTRTYGDDLRGWAELQSGTWNWSLNKLGERIGSGPAINFAVVRRLCDQAAAAYLAGEGGEE